MIGYLACLLVTIAYLPQAVQTYKSKQCHMNLYTLLALMYGMILWMIHAAIVIHDLPLLISSALSLVQVCFLGYYKRITPR